MNRVFDILKKDSQYRKSGVANDLFKLEEINSNATWDYSLPTLMSQDDLKNRSHHELDITVFRKILEHYAYPLSIIDMSNLCIAGGCVKSLILGTHFNDIDIFMYGIKSVDEANERIDKFITDLHIILKNIKSGKYVDLNIWNDSDGDPKKKSKNSLSIKHISKSSCSDQSDDNEKHNKKNKQTPPKLTPSQYRTENSHKYNANLQTSIFVLQNGNTITLHVDKLKIQFILRLYNTMSEVLHGFDLGSSAVGFDGKNVYFTSLSKFCYENMINIYDGTRRSTTYESRLQKYFHQGFKIVLPNLDISKLKTTYFKYKIPEVCELPHLPFVYDNIDKNMIIVKKFVYDNNIAPLSDYLLEDIEIEDKQVDYTTYAKIGNFNLQQLLKGKDAFIRYKIISHEINMILNKKENISAWKLKFDIPVLSPEFIVRFYNKLFKDYQQNKLSFKKIVSSFSVANSKTIVTSLLTDTDHKYMKSLVDKQKDHFFKLLDDVNKNFSVVWITENPTTQLTSSFNPIIEDQRLWYGDLFLDLSDDSDVKPKKLTKN
jgi:hypothetical protein